MFVYKGTKRGKYSVDLVYRYMMSTVYCFAFIVYRLRREPDKENDIG